MVDGTTSGLEQQPAAAMPDMGDLTTPGSAEQIVADATEAVHAEISEHATPAVAVAETEAARLNDSFANGSLAMEGIEAGAGQVETLGDLMTERDKARETVQSAMKALETAQQELSAAEDKVTDFFRDARETVGPKPEATPPVAAAEPVVAEAQAVEPPVAETPPAVEPNAADAVPITKYPVAPTEDLLRQPLTAEQASPQIAADLAEQDAVIAASRATSEAAIQQPNPDAVVPIAEVQVFEQQAEAAPPPIAQEDQTPGGTEA